MNPTEIRSLFEDLLKKPSITPNDAGCMEIIEQYLNDLNIQVQYFDLNQTRNLWITHGQGKPVIAFVGHTDVVPTGDISLWHSPPFEPTEKEGYIYGRGASDMKSGVATMVGAFKALCSQQPEHQGTLALLLTSDEEGIADDGIQAVLPLLEKNNIRIDYSIVGEPTSSEILGDTARNGRRGSLNLKLIIHGKQGHVAYPDTINNPIHGLGKIISEISQITWDHGNHDFPPTSCQFSNIEAGTGAENVVPSSAMAMLNWRFNTQQTEASIKKRITAIVGKITQELQLKAEYQWRLSGNPFSTQNQNLMLSLAKAVESVRGIDLIFNTAGGTSDARFLAQYGAETIEFGPSNKTIHKTNECIHADDLYPLAKIYEQTIINLWKSLS